MTKVRNARLLLLSIALVIAFQAPTEAQPLSTHWVSLEANIAGSNTVLLGTIESMKQSPVDYSFNPIQKTDPDGFVELEIAIRVNEVLKGDVKGPIFAGWKIVTGTHDANHRYTAWEKAKTKLLFFCGDRTDEYDVYATFAPRGASYDGRFTSYLLRLGDATEKEQSYGDHVGPPFCFSNLTWTSDITQVVNRARAYGKISKGVVGKYNLNLPAIVVHSAGGGMFWHSVAVPIDAELNELARRMIESPRSVITDQRQPNKTEIDQIRFGGVDALQFFPTDENIELLRKLLAEPFEEIQRAPPGKTVSARAFELLLEWGHDDGTIPVSADKIESLQLVGEKISDKTVTTISRFPNLKELTIADTSLTTDGFGMLVELAGVELVNVDQRLLTDESMRMLRSKKKFYKMIWANIYDHADDRRRSDLEISSLLIHGSPAITDATIDELADLRDQLTTLHLHETSITDEGLLKLHEFKALTNLTVVDTKVTEAGVNKLQKALPNCHIHSAFTKTNRD